MSFSTISFILIFNIFYDFIAKIIDKKQKENEEDIKKTLSYMLKITEMQENNKDETLRLTELIKMQIGINGQIIEKLKKD